MNFNEQKCGNVAQRGSKQKMTVLTKTGSKLPLCSPWLYKGQPRFEKQK
jgi:hypothetical protein